MRLLASYVMRGRSQAVMVTVLLGGLSLLLAPVSILSSGVVALVTLRQGVREGLLIGFLAASAFALLTLLALGDVAPGVGLLALLWLPAWFLGSVLRSTRSLALALQGALLLGVALIVTYYVQFPDPTEEWRQLLEPFSQRLVDAQLLPAHQQAELVESFALWMTGILAVLYQLQLSAALLLARWWQAVLYNPGGFRQEFHNLRLHRMLGFIALPVLALTFLGNQEGDVQLLDFAALLLMAVYFIQGLAVVHGLVGKTKGKQGWLIATYVLLIMAMPHMFVMLSVAGYVDTWFDFRARVRARD
jgi:hypothetical protein